VIECPCLISKVLEVIIREDLPETRRVENKVVTAQESGYIVRIRPNKCYDVKLRCFGVYATIWRPPTNFGGGCETGIVAKENYPGDCEHGPRAFQFNIIHHGFETHNQAISAAGASKKTEMGVRY
jgi:hypothetical protein